MRKETVAWIVPASFLLFVAPATFGWPTDGHKHIRRWAVERLPTWQHEFLGADHLSALHERYQSIQDEHAGSGDAKWTAYCSPPGVGQRLHDISPPAPSVEAIQWFLERITYHLNHQQHDEAMKYLGVLCHWNEDTASLSAHSSLLSETQLQALLPSPEALLSQNYSFGYKYALSESNKPDLPSASEYRPRLLGISAAEAATRIYQGQRQLHLRGAGQLVRAIVALTDGESQKVRQIVADQALMTAEHVADMIYTASCLAANRIGEAEAAATETEPLTQWLPDNAFTPTNSIHPLPYHVRSYLVNRGYDPDRNVVPLSLAGPDRSAVSFGFGVATPHHLDFTVAPARAWEQLEVRVGLHPSAPATGAVIFEVLLDGQVAAHAGPLRGGQAPAVLRVALPDRPVTTVRLRTRPGDGAVANHNLAVWAEPQLTRRKLK